MGEVVEFQPSKWVEPERMRARPLFRELLGEVLRRERLEQGRILTEVAREAGVSPQYLSEVERGLKEPSSEILVAVADALGMSLLELTIGIAERLGAAPRMRRVDLGTSTRPERSEASVAPPTPSTQAKPAQSALLLAA
jgi:transcriptional regulator with XRE-family HTH domain